MIGKSGMRLTYFVVIYIIYMNLIYMERGSVEANFSLHGCKTSNFTYFKKRFRSLCSVLFPESYVL